MPEVPEASRLVVKPCTNLLPLEGASNHFVFGKVVLESCHEVEHVEIGSRQVAFFEGDFLDQMHEGHIDKSFRHGVRNLLDETNRFVAIKKSALLAHSSLQVSREV